MEAVTDCNNLITLVMMTGDLLGSLQRMEGKLVACREKVRGKTFCLAPCPHSMALPFGSRFSSSGSILSVEDYLLVFVFISIYGIISGGGKRKNVGTA